MEERVQRRVVYPVGMQRLWAALTEPRLLSRWFGAQVLELEPHPGGRITFRDRFGKTLRAVVHRAEAPSHLAFRWVGPAEGTLALPGTTVEIHLEPVRGGTRLTLTESRPRPTEPSQPALGFRMGPTRTPSSRPRILARA